MKILQLYPSLGMVKMIQRGVFLVSMVFFLGSFWCMAKPAPDKNGIIEGYMDRFGYLPGDSATVFVHADAPRKAVLRLMGANNLPMDTVTFEVFQQTVANPQPYADGFGYKPSFRYKIPKLKSGIYTWENTGIFFMVKEPSRKSDIVVLYPYNTLQAYCATGGKSLYDKLSSERKASTRLSFLRPIVSRKETELTEGFIRWIIDTPYDYRYISDMDMDDYNEISESKVLIVIGHSEYWTRKARNNFDRFVKSGNDVIILSGNTMWWQIRYNEEKTQMTCYKTAHDSVKDPLLVTTTWDQVSLDYPVTKSIGCNFAGYGLKPDKGWNGFKITAETSPLMAGTKLKRGDILPCPSQEIDGAPITGLDADSIPLIDTRALGFKKIELIGFDRGSRNGKDVVHTFFVFQKNRRSGKVINVGTTNWCTSPSYSMLDVRKITTNMIDLLLEKKDVFSPRPQRK